MSEGISDLSYRS